MRNFILFNSLICILSLAACKSGADRSEGQFIIDSKCNVFLAGYSQQPHEKSDSGILPVKVSIPGNMHYVAFSDTKGKISCGGSFYDADGGDCGGGSTDLTNMGFVSGIINNNKTMFLTGVFLSDKPDINNIPQKMDASNANALTEIKPLLGQSFYIGNGLTDKKEPQHFLVPAGATKLYLGFADGYSFHGIPSAYGDNMDSLTTNLSWH